MANEYIDRATVKRALKIDPADTTRDLEIDLNREAASRRIDNATGRRFWADELDAAYTIDLRGRVVPGSCRILIPDFASITTVEAGSAGAFSEVADSAWDPYYGDAGDTSRAIVGLESALGWPFGRGKIRITGRRGWPSPPTPPVIANAALLQTIRLFNRPDSPEGITGGAEWGAISVARADPDVRDLISTYVLPGVG